MGNPSVLWTLNFPQTPRREMTTNRPSKSISVHLYITSQ